MKQIKLYVKDDRLSFLSRNYANSGGTNYYELDITFAGDIWQKCLASDGICVVFPDETDGIVPVKNLQSTNGGAHGTAVVPVQFILHRKELKLGIYGTYFEGTYADTKKVLAPTNLIVMSIEPGLTDFDYEYVPLSEQYKREWDDYIRLYYQNGEASKHITYSHAGTTLHTVGGIEQGTSYAQPTPITQILDTMLYHKDPSITTFSANKTVFEQGLTASDLSFTVNVAQGSDALTAISIYVNSSARATKGLSVKSGLQSGITFSTPLSANAQVALHVSTASKTITSSNMSISFVNPFYYGVVASAPTNSAGVTGLTKLVAVKGSKKVSFTTTSAKGRYCFAYPKSYGALTSILDKNGYPNTNDYTRTEVSVTNSGGANDYYVYTYSNVVTPGQMDMTFNF